MPIQCMKRAVIREAGYPIGTPAPCFIQCGCGNKVSLPVISGMPMTYVCLCGIEYDSRGWILNQA